MTALRECVQDITEYFEQLTADNAMLLEQSTTMMEFHEAQSREIQVLLQKSKEMLQMQVYSSTMNENLINDLLDLAKLENGKFSLHPEPFNLVQTVKAAFHIVHDIASQRGIKLQALIDDQNHLGLLQCIMGDDRRYQQILLNFLSNSLKFTNKGGDVTVLIRILDIQEQAQERQRKQLRSLADKIVNESQDEEQMLNLIQIQSKVQEEQQEPVKNSKKFIHLQIAIRDSGIWISNQNLGNLFMDFGKLDDKEGRNKSGTGLGLSICRQIIHEMGGSITVKSKVSKGTEFIIDMKVQGEQQPVVLDDQKEPVMVKMA